MSDKWKELVNHKTNEFMKVYSLSLEAKIYVKDEFKQVTAHMMAHQKSVNTEMAKILTDKEEKETKPTSAATPVVQPSECGTMVHQMEHDPMNCYNKADW